MAGPSACLKLQHNWRIEMKKRNARIIQKGTRAKDSYWEEKVLKNFKRLKTKGSRMRDGTRRENCILGCAAKESAKDMRASLYCESFETFIVGVRKLNAECNWAVGLSQEGCFI